MLLHDVLGFEHDQSAAAHLRQCRIALTGIDSEGARRLHRWDVDLNPFRPKAGEVLIGRDVRGL